MKMNGHWQRVLGELMVCPVLVASNGWSQSMLPQGKGFQVDAPLGRASQAAQGRVKAISPDGMEFVSAEGLLPGAANKSAEAMLRDLKGQARYLGGQAQGAGSATAAYLNGGTRVHALLTLRGGMGTLMLAGAPQQRFSARLPALVRILGSISFEKQAGGSGGKPGIDSVVLQD